MNCCSIWFIKSITCARPTEHAAHSAQGQGSTAHARARTHTHTHRAIERVRDRERQRERDTHTQRERESDRERHTERDRQTERERGREGGAVIGMQRCYLCAVWRSGQGGTRRQTSGVEALEQPNGCTNPPCVCDLPHQRTTHAARAPGTTPTHDTCSACP